MFAFHIGGEMLLTTSTNQIILFKYAKVYRVDWILLHRPVGFSQRSWKLMLKSWKLQHDGSKKYSCNQGGQNISTNVNQTKHFYKCLSNSIVQ